LSRIWRAARRLAIEQARRMTDAEDTRIARGIAADPDTVELDANWFAEARAVGRERMPSKTPKQKRTMAWAAHDPKAAKKLGIPQKVAKEFNRADAAKGKRKGKRGS
jgi:hypothetical protein